MAAPRSDCRATIRRFEIVFAAALAGCAALERDLAPARDSWQGATYADVVRQWGAPARSAGDTHTWYSEDRRRPRSGVGIIISNDGSGAFGSLPFGAAGETVRCDRSLTFRDGVVVEQRWQGPADYCVTFRR